MKKVQPAGYDQNGVKLHSAQWEVPGMPGLFCHRVISDRQYGTSLNGWAIRFRPPADDRADLILNGSLQMEIAMRCNGKRFRSLSEASQAALVLGDLLGRDKPVLLF